MRKTVIAILTVISVVSAVCMNKLPVSADGRETLQMIEMMRAALKEQGLLESQRNFLSAALAVALENSGMGGAESDSLVNAAWMSEQMLPLDQQNFQTYQTIAAYHILSANKKDLSKALDMMEKTCTLDGRRMDKAWLGYRSFLLSAKKQEGDIVSARKIVAEDLQRLSGQHLEASEGSGITVSRELIDYLWNCYRFMEQENAKDSNALFYCLSLIVKYTGEYVALTGAENTELSMIAPLMETLMKPLLAPYVSSDDVIKMVTQLESLFDNRQLSESDRIDYVKILTGKADYLMRTCADPAGSQAAAEKALTVADDDWDRLRAYMAMMQLYIRSRNFTNIRETFPKFSRLVKSTGENDYTYRCIEAMFDMSARMADGDEAGAIEAADRFFNIIKDEWDNQMPFMTTADRDNFIAKNGDPLGMLAVTLEKYPEETAGKVYDGILYRTGMQLRAQKEMADALNNSSNPEIMALKDSLQLLKTRYNRVGQVDVSALQLNMRIRNLERMIMDMVGRENHDIRKLPKWKDVQKRLKKREAAIEFIFTPTFLYALVVRAGEDSPAPVALSTSRDFVDFMTSRSRKTTAETARVLYEDDGLYRLLWLPMKQELEGVDKIYLSVPGALNGISFNAIITPEGKTLFDEYEIRRLTTTGNLVEKGSKDAPGDALMVGDVNFVSQGAQAQVDKDDTKEDEIAIDDFSDRGVARRHFRQLPFTSSEVDSISRILSRREVRVLSGDDASEAKLRKELEKIPDILHLATHGFFIANVEDALKVPYMNKHRQAVSSSMQRAGVALAGAEQSWTGGSAADNNDGILTALEVADMNLKGVRLVALSACETALGNYTFDGVFGLPRGFKQAGVESLLVSLWSVNDKATSLFMSEFYRNWEKSNDRHAAYRAAMKKVREEYLEPFYWASFILLD